jgi:hypothetical protein
VKVVRVIKASKYSNLNQNSLKGFQIQLNLEMEILIFRLEVSSQIFWQSKHLVEGSLFIECFFGGSYSRRIPATEKEIVASTSAYIAAHIVR